MKMCLVIFLTLNWWTPLFAAQGSSFNDIRAMVYDKPRGEDLPAYQGLSKWDVIKNLLGSEDQPKHGLSVQSRRILVDTSDVRDTDEVKWLHPRGICAEARWVITEKNEATGLFVQGTNVPAIVRLSSGDGASEYPTEGRIFGLAVKVFPTTNLNKQVATANYISLDQDGFDRSKRKYVFFDGKKKNGVYFTNVAPAKSALGQFLSTFFDRFDNPNWARPLYAFSLSSVDGVNANKKITPYEVRFVASSTMQIPQEEYSDFRLELLNKQKRTLDIIIQSYEGKKQVSQKIGYLELGDFVVSDFCDLKLRFHHNPIEDQWEKYMDYDVVKDL